MDEEERAWRLAWGDPLDPTVVDADEIAEAFEELAEGYRPDDRDDAEY